MDNKIRAPTHARATTTRTPPYNVVQCEAHGPHRDALIYFLHSANLSGVLNIVCGVTGDTPRELLTL